MVMPTFGLWNKQASLALQFAHEYGGLGGMGYAYTPLAEGIANFGVLGVIIVPAYLTMSGFTLLSSKIVAPVVFLVFVSISLNINRGEFSSIVQQLFIIAASMHCFLAMTRRRAGAGSYNMPQLGK
jgi:hypothetical protein